MPINNTPYFVNDSVFKIKIPENTKAIARIAAIDLDANDDLSYSLVGADASLFEVDINGNISFINKADFESPNDFDANNIYHVAVQATDASGLNALRQLEVSVIDDRNIISKDFVTSKEEFRVDRFRSDGDEFNPKTTYLKGGGFVVVWETKNRNSTKKIVAQVYDASGDPVGGETSVDQVGSQSSSKTPAITALENGGFVVTWTNEPYVSGYSGSDIKAKVFNSTGQLVGNEIIVSTETLEDQSHSSVTGLADGGYVITWTTVDDFQDGSGYAVLGKVYNEDGSVRVQDFVVNSITYGGQGAAVITSLPEGGFVVSWRSQTEILGEIELIIKAKTFDANGIVVVDEFTVNNLHYAGTQYNLSIASLTDGGFVVTWQTTDVTQDTSGTAIKAQIHNADGSIRVSEFRANITGYNGDQIDPSIAALSDGTFVIVWTTKNDYLDQYSWAIKAQSYDAVGNAIGDEILVNTIRPDGQSEASVSAGLDGGFIVTWKTYVDFDGSNKSDIKSKVYASQQTITPVEDIIGTPEIDNIIGTQYGDKILALEGDDVIQGKEGEDIIYGGAGDDTIYGGDGDDYLEGQDGDDTILGGAGDDRIEGGWGNDTLLGGDGDDYITGHDGNDKLYGGAGNDQLYSQWGQGEIHGGDGNDIIAGHNENDILNGDAGNDTITGNGGVDIIYGGIGEDTIYGGTGDDTIYGGEGVDYLEGQDGKDTIYGGAGDDRIEGGWGDDTLHGGDGDDYITGHDGEDVLYGDAGDDQLYSQWGQGEIHGGDGNDIIAGHNENDILNGDAGNDTITGNGGDDSIYGGTGNDLFIIKDNSGHDVIGDFMGGVGISDKIQIEGYGISTFTDLQILMTETAGTTVIEFDVDNTLVLTDVLMSLLVSDDFSLIA